MAGFADGDHKVGFHILLPRIGNCHLRSIDIKQTRRPLSFSVVMGGLATQPINNSARQVLIDISRIFIISSFL
jgi:hypothetical protein